MSVILRYTGKIFCHMTCLVCHYWAVTSH